MNELRNLGDKLKSEIGSGVVLIVSAQGSDKVNMIAMATDDAIAKGAHAGNLIKSLAGLVGGGGGVGVEEIASGQTHAEHLFRLGVAIQT